MAQVTWAVTGGKFTADSARAEAFNQSGGGRGVSLPGDLKVTALSTPGPFVNVAPGGATFPAGYPGAPGQSYSTLETAQVQVPVAATGSGGSVTKYLVQRVTDPQFEGSVPADPINHEYVTYEWLPLSAVTGTPTVPLVILARLIQPANTATITNAMLTDYRKLVRPHTERHVRMSGPTPEQQMPAGLGGIWPDYRPQIFVPEWATHLDLIVHLVSVGHRNGAVNGQLTVTLGDPPVGNPLQVRAANAGIDLDLPPGAGVRVGLMCGGSGPIPAGMRGGTFSLGTEAIKQSGAGNLWTVNGTQVIYDVTFKQAI